MGKIVDLTGNQYGRLTVVSFARQDKSGGSMWLCKCECGTKKVIRSNALRSGRSKSCGCMIGVTHGNRRVKKTSPAYMSWSSMHSRCSNVKDPYYDKYGGRGIAVCERWKKFEIFLSDMGARPPGHTLDRIDVNKGYSPENCRWATPKTQSRNKRNNHLIDTPSGRVCITQASEIYGIKVQTLRRRLNQGWSIERALLTKPWQKPV